MQMKLWTKFVIVYLVFAFLSLFVIAAILPDMTETAMIKHASDTLYREANLVASTYMSEYDDEYFSRYRLRQDLAAVSEYLQSSIWLVKTDNTVDIASGDNYAGEAPDTLSDFHPAEIISNRYEPGNFNGLFDEDVITVCVPVNVEYKLIGYVLIHQRVSVATQMEPEYMRMALFTFGIILFLSLGIMAAYYYFVQRPLEIVITAAREYRSGNLAYAIPINTNDEFGYLASSLNDMSNQLNDIDEGQRQFIANISHDLRSPLTSIKGYSEAIADGTIPPEAMEKYLKIIVFETERLTNLTTDLMALAKFDKKGRSFTLEDFDINEVIKTTAISFEGRCRDKKLDIELLFADYSTYVHADRSRIQQVFYNLLDNAIKFSNKESVITIETTVQGKKLRVSVKDYGCGVPKDSVTKIFDRFYKTDLSRGVDKTGTGLGLAIVKEIIQAHGENITCISTEGVSTEFVFTLPLKSV